MKQMKIVLLVSLFLVSGIAQAASGGSVWLVSGGTTAGYVMSTSGTPSTSLLMVSGKVGHSLGMFELLGYGSYTSTTAGTVTTSSNSFAAHLYFAVGGNHSQALYFGGYYFLTGTKDYGAIIGKRFHIACGVSYDPSIDYNLNAASKPLAILPLQFTLVF